MATITIATDNVGLRERVKLEPGDDAVVQAGVLVSSTDWDAIVGFGSGHTVVVYGSVSADMQYGFGIWLGDTFEDSGNLVRIAAGGFVSGSYGIRLSGSSNTLYNDGDIFGAGTGVLLGAGVNSVSRITNTGAITAANTGISVDSAGTGTAVFTNYGHLEGAALAYSGGYGIDRVLNRGTVVGDIVLGSGNDLYDGLGGTLEGRVFGGFGDDMFIAGASIEQFSGNEGVDTLDFRSSAGLRVSLLDDSGTGRAQGDTYTGFERVLGSSTGGDELIGDDLANTLEGWGGADTLVGNGDNDSLLGGDGNDTLLGGAGHDTLDGGIGTDRLDGGLGNDVYIVTSGDTVVEGSGAGVDEVRTGSSVTLAANVENLLLTGSSALNGTGNGLNNLMTGNSGANVLSGAAGLDTLSGGGGNDTLLGGAGKDTLTGGAGNDAFQFTSRTEGGDLITDFSNVSGNDDLFRISAVGFGGGLVAGTILASSQFRARADNLAQDLDDRFIFRTADKTLWFDADGKGGAAGVMIADLQSTATITSADIWLM